jgi:hypothetical protein
VKINHNEGDDDAGLERVKVSRMKLWQHNQSAAMEDNVSERTATEADESERNRAEETQRFVARVVRTRVVRSIACAAEAPRDRYERNKCARQRPRERERERERATKRLTSCWLSRCTETVAQCDTFQANVASDVVVVATVAVVVAAVAVTVDTANVRPAHCFETAFDLAEKSVLKWTKSTEKSVCAVFI